MLAGHRRTRVYGRLDCPVALSWIRRGSAMAHRVFFADEAAAVAAGYRPCGACLPARYVEWTARGVGDADARRAHAPPG